MDIHKTEQTNETNFGKLKQHNSPFHIYVGEENSGANLEEKLENLNFLSNSSTPIAKLKYSDANITSCISKDLLLRLDENSPIHPVKNQNYLKYNLDEENIVEEEEPKTKIPGLEENLKYYEELNNLTNTKNYMLRNSSSQFRNCQNNDDNLSVASNDSFSSFVSDNPRRAKRKNSSFCCNVQNYFNGASENINQSFGNSFSINNNNIKTSNYKDKTEIDSNEVSPTKKELNKMNPFNLVLNSTSNTTAKHSNFKGWECKMCSHTNEQGLIVCERCFNSRLYTQQPETANQVSQFFNINCNNSEKIRNLRQSKTEINDNDRRKKKFTERVGDWVCISCKNLNFSFRLNCNRCQLPKGESQKMSDEYMKNLVKYVKCNEMIQAQILMNPSPFSNPYVNNNININNNFYNFNSMPGNIHKYNTYVNNSKNEDFQQS